MGLKVPATLMHVHALNVTLDSDVTAAHVRQLLDGESRVYVIPEGFGLDGAGKLKDFALDAGRPRGDIWENCVWGENVDAIRAMTDAADAAESIERTNRTLGLGLAGDPTGFSDSETVGAEAADD
jgi:glyceraldehyde-3-phosphate dehydrogenase (NAD(P))